MSHGRDFYAKTGWYSYFPFDGGLFPLPPPEGLPVLEGQFGLFAIVYRFNS